MTELAVRSVDIRRDRRDYRKLSQLLYGAQNIQGYRVTAWVISAIGVGTLHEWLSDLPWVQKNIFYDYGAFYMAGMVALFFLVGTLVFRVIGRNIEYIAPNQSFLRPQRFEIDPEGIKHSSEVGHAFLSWKGVTKLLRTRDYLLFYADAMSAHLIPVRSFASGAAADVFYKEARALWTAANEPAARPA